MSPLLYLAIGLLGGRIFVAVDCVNSAAHNAGSGAEANW